MPPRQKTAGRVGRNLQQKGCYTINDLYQDNGKNRRNGINEKGLR